MTDSEQQPVHRLAIRSEGEWVVCYLADMGSMDGAVEIARILKDVVGPSDGPVFIGFCKLMQAVYTQLAEAQGVTVDHFGQQDAPEHERSGHA